MDPRGILRREEDEEEVGGLAVDRGEVDAALRPAEGREQVRHPGQLAVGDGHALPHAGGAQLLPLEQDLGQPSRVEAVRAPERSAQFAQDARLVGGLQVGEDQVLAQELGDLHRSGTVHPHRAHQPE